MFGLDQNRRSTSSEYAQMVRTLPRGPSGDILDACGFAYVTTYDAHSAITQALLELGLVKVGELGYYVVGLLGALGTEQSITLAKEGAQAAADSLTHSLGQKFYVEARLD